MPWPSSIADAASRCAHGVDCVKCPRMRNETAKLGYYVSVPPREKGSRSMRQGFDNEKYIASQAEHIKERIAQFGGKLYLEFGGKLFDDFHASRVLPGFEPDSKFLPSSGQAPMSAHPSKAYRTGTTGFFRY